MLRWTAWLWLLALVALPPSSRAQPARIPACESSEAFTMPEAPLDQVAAAIAAGGPVRILALGSATTVGDQVGAEHHGAFPYRMLEALQTELPKVTFELTIRGGRGMTALAMLPMLESALAGERYALVLWQTGTVEAVRGQGPDGLLAALQEGIERARDTGADVVLVDPQFSRFLRANVDLDPYEVAMQQIAVMPGVALFHRFDVMQNWAEAGRIDLERTRKEDRSATMALLNACLGQTLARFVLNGAGVTPR